VVRNVRFVETIRLPQPYLGVFVVYAVVATAGLAVLWSVATLTTGQRVVLGAAVAACVAFLFVAPLHLIVMHVVVDDEAITRSVGHRRRRSVSTADPQIPQVADRDLSAGDAGRGATRRLRRRLAHRSPPSDRTSSER
jgi:hypothetical protein